MKLTDSFGDERAVSPVVGVILMVAITVILAAVIGTFVLDLGNNQTAPPRAGLSFSQSETSSGNYDVTITVTDPGNVDSIDLKKNGAAVDMTTLGASSDPDSKVQAGDVYSGTALNGLSSGTTIQVIGSNNGQSGVVSTYTV